MNESQMHERGLKKAYNESVRLSGVPKMHLNATAAPNLEKTQMMDDARSLLASPVLARTSSQMELTQQATRICPVEVP